MKQILISLKQFLETVRMLLIIPSDPQETTGS